MFYKVYAGTETGRKFIALMKEAEQCIREAHKFVEGLGAKRYVSRGFGWGGVSAVEFDAPPKDWVKTKRDDGTYYPRSDRKSTRKVCEDISNLPVVEGGKLGKVVGMKSWIVGGRLYEWPGGTSHNDKVAVFTIADVLKDKYEKPADVIEITSEEYDSLVKEIEASYSEKESE